MRYVRYTLIVLFAICSSVNAQEKWDLRKIVDYAMTNNITVKQSEVQASVSQLVYNQSKLALFPNVSFSGNEGFYSGRNQDPTTYRLITQSYWSAGMQLQTSADIFNFYSKKNLILSNQWELEAAKANTNKLKNDIALTAANGYLQVLLAIEQENIARVQLRQTQAQLSNTRKLVNAGSLPELNAAELEAQEARDSANYVSAKGNVTQTILVLKSYMNFDAAAPFDVSVPPIELIPIEKIADLQPEAVFALALANQPLQKFNNYKLKAAEKASQVYRGNMYPNFFLFGNLGSGYNSRAEQITGSRPVISPIGKVSVSGVDYSVLPITPFVDFSYGSVGVTKQFEQNFRQSVGIGVSVPIFNGAQARTNWQRSKLNIRTIELQQEADNQKVKQDIYQAYNAALVALEKFNASSKSVSASQRTLDFAQKRYDVGMLGTFELITNQNNLFRAKLEYVLNQYDYVFKMKVLEFYKGQGLRL
ncbi:MAG: TolC family protein [Bacteroidota bacterium]|nr:TolC family protein [Ferruginibacter sp.]